MFQNYGKSIIAALYAVAVVAVPLLTPGHTFNAADGIAVAIAAGTALLTYVIPLFPRATWTKTAVGAVMAGLQVAAGLVVGGIDGNGWLSVIAAVIAFLGITVAPAVSTSTKAAHGLGTA